MVALFQFKLWFSTLRIPTRSLNSVSDSFTGTMRAPALMARGFSSQRRSRPTFHFSSVLKLFG